MNRIQFKSLPVHWIKEHLDIKRNTIRDIKEDDIRYEILCNWLKSPFKLIVGIENTVSHDISDKEVKDVTVFNGLFIISW